MKAFAVAVILTAQTLLSPLAGVHAAEENNTLGTTTTDFTTYEAYKLNQIDVTDAYLTNAEDKDIEYLLSLDTDRLLAGFRETAGVDMKGKQRYAGWENMLIGGHTMGHYLTAVAQAVATLPSDDARDKELSDRLDYVIDSLKECQDALGTGFIFGGTIRDKITSSSNLTMLKRIKPISWTRPGCHGTPCTKF